MPLRDATDDWTVVSYEQLVLEPHLVIAHLVHKLALPKPARMLQRLVVPLASKGKSDQETQVILDGEEARRVVLVEKWRQHVSEAEERHAMEILERFHLDAYRAGDVRPAGWLWLEPRTTTQPLATS